MIGFVVGFLVVLMNGIQVQAFAEPFQTMEECETAVAKVVEASKEHPESPILVAECRKV